LSELNDYSKKRCVTYSGNLKADLKESCTSLYASMMIGLPLDLDPNFVNVDIDDYRLFREDSVSVEKLEYYENENNKASKMLCCV